MSVRAERALALAAAVGVVVVFVLDAWWRGALGQARNDDWSYVRIAFVFASTHHLQLNGWAAPMLVGQIALAWPVAALFQNSVMALQLLTAIEGALGLWLWYLVFRRALPIALAALSCLTIAIGPLFGILAVSFMSDVPALFAQALTVWL